MEGKEGIGISPPFLKNVGYKVECRNIIEEEK
jgi:hypothetical protein